MTDKKKDRPKHLGRGLQSLLGPITPESPDLHHTIPITAFDDKFPKDRELHDSLRNISINDIRPNPYQPRGVWNQQELNELADSIRTNGVIQPIVVRPAGLDFELIAGERRFRASKLAGLKTIPALIRQANDKQLLELALVENIHRADLNPIERARAYQNYVDTFSLTQEQAAEKLGENRSVVANYIRLLRLPKEIQQMLVEGKLSMGHARAILALPTDDLRRKLANLAMAGRLSVREVERLVQKHLLSGRKNGQQNNLKPIHIQDLETKLTNQLGTKVSIEARKNGQRGKIIIEFYSLDEFDRISEQIGLGAFEKV